VDYHGPWIRPDESSRGVYSIVWAACVGPSTPGAPATDAWFFQVANPSGRTVESGHAATREDAMACADSVLRARGEWILLPELPATGDDIAALLNAVQAL